MSRSCLTFQPFNLASCIRYKTIVEKAKIKMQLRKMTLTLQRTKQNDMLAKSNTYKISKNKHTIDEDKSK